MTAPTADRVLVAFESCGCWAGSATRYAPMTAAQIVGGVLDHGWRTEVMAVEDVREIETRCPEHALPGARAGRARRVAVTALVWAWPNYGRRWHLRASGAEVALCGVGKRGWELVGDDFDRNAEDIYVCACIPCLRAERLPAPASAAADGGA